MNSNFPNNFNYKSEWYPWFIAVIMIFMLLTAIGICTNIGTLISNAFNPYPWLRLSGFNVFLISLSILVDIALVVGEIGLLLTKSWGFYLTVGCLAISIILNIISSIGNQQWIALITGILFPVLEGAGLIYVVYSGLATINRQNPFAQEFSKLPLPFQSSQNPFPGGNPFQGSSPKQCPNCGALLKPNQNFCSHCGTSIQ